MDDMRLSCCISSYFLLFIFLSSFASAEANKYLVYVATYAVRGSKGIYAYRYDAATGQLVDLGLAAETPSPAFLAISPNQKFLYAVNEIDEYQGQSSGIVSAFAVDTKTGKLTLLNQVASKGASPCHISLDQTGKFVLVANYTGGSLGVFPVGEDGRLGEASDFIQHRGHGPNVDRQDNAHPHWIGVSADNRFALNADLGMDKVFVYHFDAGKGKLTPGDPPFVTMPPGAGPRHFAFHPSGKFVYLINELNLTITAFSLDTKAGKLKELQTVPTLPKGASSESTTAEIVMHPSGKFLYGSNRGHDSLAVFAIDPAKGTVTLVEHVSVKGKTPRNFEIDPSGKRLLVANQNSDNIVEFAIDPVTGTLTPTGTELKVSAAVCIKFLALE